MAWGGAFIGHPRTAWSASLTATTTNPTGWTRTDAATYYQQIGKLVLCRFRFTASSATWGSGAWQLALPVNAVSKTQAYIARGECYTYNNNNTSYGTTMQTSTTTVQFADIDGWFFKWGYGSGYKWTSGSPTNGGSFTGYFFYEAA